MSSPTDRKRLGELLHQRLLSGSDLTVTSEIAEEFLPALTRRLAKEFHQLPDPHLITTAVNDALLNLFDHPAQFDPARSSLFTYLRLRARTYLLNSLSRRKSSPAQDKVVELDDAGTVYEVEAHETDAETSLISREFQAGVIAKLRRVFTDPADLRVIALMVEGVRETQAYAEALGVADRPAEEQKKLVKQAKDRINKIFERKFRRKGRRG
jgi:DNA-directed RNA polymerase specialized sigma24 family protein